MKHSLEVAFDSLDQDINRMLGHCRLLQTQRDALFQALQAVVNDPHLELMPETITLALKALELAAKQTP